MRLILMGPPGAGKGTQAKCIAQHAEVPAISTGGIFRDNILRQTPIGIQARRFTDAGEYVPDDVTNAMVRTRLSATDCATGFVLDGYPRTLRQARELDRMLAQADNSIDVVLVLSVEADELVERLARRAQIEGRVDDTADVIRRRQQVYLEQTRPVFDDYSRRDLVVSVSGSGSVGEVTDRLLAGLDNASASQTLSSAR